MAAGRLLVGAHERLSRRHATSGQRRPEAPRTNAEPPEVLERVPDVGELPVEHRAQPLPVDEQVAHPQVAVDHARRVLGRPVRLQPSEAQLEGRVRLRQPVEHRPVLGDLVGRLQSLHRLDGDGVDRRRGRADLRTEALARHRPLLIAQQLARDGLPRQPLHHHPRAAQHATVVAGHHAGDGNAMLRGGSKQGRLRLHAHPAAARGGSRPEPLQDQLLLPSPVDEVEGPRLSRRAARESPQPLDRRVPVGREQGPEGERQLVGPHETGTVGERPDPVPLGVRVASRRPLRTGTG